MGPKKSEGLSSGKRRLVLLALAAALLMPGCIELDVNHLFLYDAFLFEDTPFAINRVVILMWFAGFLCVAFFVAGARGRVVPRGLQGLVEDAYLFVRNNIAIDVIGPKDGPKYANYLVALFFFIFFGNLLEIVPFVNFPVTARMAIPLFLAVVTWVIFNVIGLKKQGWQYIKGTLFPPGVPKFIYLLLTPIEALSVFIIRPFTLAVRLFANMVAGHTLLTIFFLFTHMFLVDRFLQPSSALGIATAAIAAILIVFELLVISLQAYIFTMLTAFYIAEAIHGHGEEDVHVDTKHQPVRETEGLAEAAV